MSDALSDDGHGFWRFCPRDVSAYSLVCEETPLWVVTSDGNHDADSWVYYFLKACPIFYLEPMQQYPWEKSVVWRNWLGCLEH